MGQAQRDAAKDVFSLQWLLDPGRDSRNRAMDQQQQATDLWLGALEDAPGADQLYVNERMVDGAPSQFAGLQPGQIQDGVGQEAQLQALRQMQGIASAGGYTDLERSQIAKAQRDAARYEQGQRAAVQQQMAMRGFGGAGANMAAQLQGRQASANMAQDSANQIATQAQMRALQAMQASSQMGNTQQQNAMQRQGQQYSQSAQRAGAIDAFNQANTNRAQGVQTRNTTNRQVANQQGWDNRTGVLAGATQQYNANAGNAFARANDQNAQATGLLNTVLGAVS